MQDKDDEFLWDEADKSILPEIQVEQLKKCDELKKDLLLKKVAELKNERGKE